MTEKDLTHTLLKGIFQKLETYDTLRLTKLLYKHHCCLINGVGFLKKKWAESLIDLKVNENYIWIYFIAFYALWCIRELWLVEYLALMDSVPGAVTSAIIKIIICVIPVILLVKILEKSNPFSYLGLYIRKVSFFGRVRVKCLWENIYPIPFVRNIWECIEFRCLMDGGVE